MREPTTAAPPEKPVIALSFEDADAVENEVFRIEGAIAVLLRLVDSLDESAGSAVNYVAMQLSEHHAGLECALKRGRAPRPESEAPARPEILARDALILCRHAAHTVASSRDGTPAHDKPKAEARRAKVTYDRLAPVGELCDEAERLLQSLFRDIAESAGPYGVREVDGSGQRI